MDLITAVLRSLHWRHVCQIIQFKKLLFVYKALNALGPKYFPELLLHYEPSRLPRSSGAGLLSVPRAKTRCGEAEFSFYAPHVWNKLPEKLGACSNSQYF